MAVGASARTDLSGVPGSAARLGLRTVRESPGAPSRISPKTSSCQGTSRTISGVQRSAKISAPRAIGQHCGAVRRTARLRRLVEVKTTYDPTPSSTTTGTSARKVKVSRR